MPIVNSSPWQRHQAKWKQCTLCDACNRRKNVVLLRGDIPCDVLFVGESPGLSEDSRGIPFHGPAGKELDEIIATVMESLGELSVAITNIVACIPAKDDRGKLLDPSVESIDACRPRLLDIIDICQPRLIVALGKLAAKYLRYEGTATVIEVAHPSAIIQADLSQRGLMRKRIVVALRDAIEELL